MYSTCIFCNSHLGRNGVLESFSTGRRLAYDAAKGRLWVVCPRCERWNLTPLETRWEAIEDAERLFRTTRLRVSTDNIGMAQHTEGLQLVRIGAPPKLELAGWRYGDQFGRRRRRTAITTGGSLVAVGAILTGTIAGSMSVAGAGAIATAATLGQYLQMAVGSLYAARYRRVPRLAIRDDLGATLHLTAENAREAALAPVRETGGWVLRVRHSLVVPARGLHRLTGSRVKAVPAGERVSLHGEHAMRAISQVMPFANMEGGSERRVREAVTFMGESANIEQLLNTVSNFRHTNRVIPGESCLASLPPRMRLALEMVIHSEDERRAMDGELALLEQRWRDAEEVAAIADAMFLPQDIDDRLSTLRERQRQAPQPHGIQPPTHPTENR